MFLEFDLGRCAIPSVLWEVGTVPVYAPTRVMSPCRRAVSPTSVQPPPRPKVRILSQILNTCFRQSDLFTIFIFSRIIKEHVFKPHIFHEVIDTPDQSYHRGLRDDFFLANSFPAQNSCPLFPSEATALETVRVIRLGPSQIKTTLPTGAS